MTKKEFLEELQCWVVAIVVVCVFIGIGILFLHRDGPSRIKEAALDTAAKASVSFEERQDKFRSE